MECFFININHQAARRDFLELNFAQHKAAGWYLNRVEAIDLAYLAHTPATGSLRETEKGCFLSHKRALRDALEAPGHALILEDDALFGPTSCRAIENALASTPEDAWDLMYTDLGIYHPPLMAGLLQIRRELTKGPGQVLMNAQELTFCGATAYIVNERFKPRLAELIDVPTLDRPYDVLLRDLLLAGKLRAQVIFPFPTSLSPLADTTQIQESDAKLTDRVFNSFRRFIWVDRDLTSALAPMEVLGSDFMDEEAAAFSRIIGAAFSDKIKLG